MNVSLQNIDKVSALLTVKLEKADYQEKVDKSLKNFRQKAQIPGFRKGMVPMSLVKKMYGKSVLAEEVNKLLSDSVYKYIQDNKVNIGCSSFYCGWRWYQRFHFQYYCSYISIGNISRNLYDIK